MLREKRIKEWKRDWKLNLIERDNPGWIDLLSKSLMLNRANSGMGTGLRRCDVSGGGQTLLAAVTIIVTAAERQGVEKWRQR